MHLHILFSATSSRDANGVALPTARLQLTLDDEVQYRCAGFIQAEIERYAEELELASPEETPDADADGSGNENSQDEHPSKPNGTTKRKHPTEDSASNLLVTSNVLLIFV